MKLFCYFNILYLYLLIMDFQTRKIEPLECRGILLLQTNTIIPGIRGIQVSSE